jgi:tetratricopeptide (TPR) repeat protein
MSRPSWSSTRPARTIPILLATLLVGACGGSKKHVEAPALARADNQALSGMVKGVDLAKQKSGKDQAIELLRAAVQRDPSLWEARYNLGVLLAQRDRLAEAEPELAKAAELAPNAEDVALALAEVQRRRGHPDAAADGLERFVKAQPTAIDARAALVFVLRESNQLDAAIANAHEVLKRRPSDAEALSALALAHAERGEMDVAELLSEEALKAEKKSAAAERTAGLVSLKRGDDAIAFQHFARASEIDPKDTTARLNMGVVLLAAGIYPRAEKEFRAVLDVEPQSDEAILGLAAALRGQGKRGTTGPFNEAEKLLKGLLEREPDHVAASFNLAVLYSDFMGKNELARPLFQRFLEEAPEKHPGRPIAEKFLRDNKSEAPAAAPKPATPAATTKTPPRPPAAKHH